MKPSDNAEALSEELDFERLNEEIDILFGNILGATTMVESHLESNFPHYNESHPLPLLKENQGDIRRVNELMRLYAAAPSDKLPQ